MDTASKTGNPINAVLISNEVIAALLGALAGGLATYWATSYQEYRKQRRLALSLTSLVILEMLDHLNKVQLALDHVLPQWFQIDRPGYELNEVQLPSKIFN